MWYFWGRRLTIGGGFRFIDAPEGADYLATDEAFNYSNLAWQALVDCLVFPQLHSDIFLEFHFHVSGFWFLAALSCISLCSYVT